MLGLLCTEESEEEYTEWSLLCSSSASCCRFSRSICFNDSDNRTEEAAVGFANEAEDALIGGAEEEEAGNGTTLDGAELAVAALDSEALVGLVTLDSE